MKTIVSIVSYSNLSTFFIFSPSSQSLLILEFLIPKIKNIVTNNRFIYILMLTNSSIC